MKVAADYPRAETAPIMSTDRSLDEVYADYYLDREGVALPAELRAAFLDVMEEATSATA
ncbi:MAG: hypothetical protein HKN07_13045 [Acidimicrobiia bacterium]|nr:hypothetical protein [Acidimicrobiia bacterium]